MSSKKRKTQEPTIFDQIEDKDDEQQAIRDFNNLKRHAGWKRIVDYLTGQMQYEQTKINGDFDVPEPTDPVQFQNYIKLNRFKKDFAEKMIDLPDILVAYIEKQIEDPTGDPYYTADELDATLKQGNK